MNLFKYSNNDKRYYTLTYYQLFNPQQKLLCTTIINDFKHDTHATLINKVKQIKTPGVRILVKGLVREQELNLICDQLELLAPHLVIVKLGNHKIATLINQILIKRNTYQGFKTNILNKSKQLLLKLIKNDDLVIDATIGNGHDTLFLAKLVPQGHVYGFDIQKEAVHQTASLLDAHHLNNYTLYQTSHSKMHATIPHLKGKIKAITFNLGYLPGGNKNITTTATTTLKALKTSLEILCPKGMCFIVVYPGHKAGMQESNHIKQFLTTSNYYYQYYYNTTNPHAPYLITIKK